MKAGMQNYEDVTFTVNIELVDQIPVKLKEGSSVTLQSSALTYGQALSSLSFNTADFVSDDTDEKPVEGTLAWKEPDTVPDAGDTRAVWIFTPADMDYASLEGTAVVTVNREVCPKKTAEGRARYGTAGMLELKDYIAEGGRLSGIGDRDR